jgi:hypothetical protein
LRSWDNKPEYDRLLTHEKHGVTCPESLEGGERNWFSLSGLLRSAWHHVKVSEDAGFYPEAKGFRLPGTNLSWGNEEQIEEILQTAWTACKNHKRRKEFVFGFWPAEVFVKVPGGIRQLYRVGSINWKRLEAVERARKKVFEEV